MEEEIGKFRNNLKDLERALDGTDISIQEKQLELSMDFLKLQMKEMNLK